MLKKIISIRNVGKFADYQYEGDLELRKLNIIYADNGQGKTTLATILRSLKLGEGSLIEGRRTLGTSGEPEVNLLLDDSTLAFKDGKWETDLPDLEIFDSTFIAENVYSGGYVGHEHKRDLYRFVIGAKGVSLRKKVDHLDGKNRAKATKIGEKENEIKTYISDSVKVSDFLELLRPPQGAITEKEKEIRALETAEEIAEKSALDRISLPSIPWIELEELLVKSITSISKEAEQRVREHVACCMDKDGESWIESGLDYIKDSSCPFCGQSLAGNELIEAYQAYFGAAYQHLKEEIEDLLENIRSLLSEDEILSLQRRIGANNELIEFWNDHVQASYPEIEFEAIQEAWQNVRKLLVESLEHKAAAPLELMASSEALEAAIEAYDSMSKAADDYNQTLSKANELIEAKKEETKEGDLSQAGKELDDLKHQQSRHKPEVDRLCKEYKELCEEKKTLESEKQQAKDKLDEYADEVIEAYETSTNEHLHKCGAEVGIIELDRNYLGGKPRIEYRLQVDGEAVDLGKADTPADEPSFKNTFGSGDQSALAFSFFIARLKQYPDSELQDKIVVLDDPASSLDAQRKTYTCHQVIWLARHCEQVIVLTHNAHFARQIWDCAKGMAPRTLWVKRKGNYSVIENLDIVEKTQGEYFKNYSDISEYLEEGPEDDSHMRAVARCIRPLLEYYLRVRFPKEFKANEWLGSFVEKLSKAEKCDALYSFKPRLEELSEINDYSSKYHHGQNPNCDSEPISDGALSLWANKTLDSIS